MGKLNGFLFLFLLSMGVSCSGQKGLFSPKNMANVKDSTLLEVVLTDNYSGVEHSEFQVVYDVKALREFFLQINKTRKPGIPLPEVDFTKECILIYCAGTTMGSGSLELIVVDESQENITIGLKKPAFSKKESRNIITTPFCIYKMSLTDKEIVFSKM